MAKWLDKYKDKEKRREYNKIRCKEYYKVHKKELIKQSVKSQRIKRKRFRASLIKGFGNKCQICGFDECIGILQFHHDHNKVEAISIMIRKNIPYKKIEEEAKKCQLLCPNCHMRIHYDETFIGVKV